MERMNFTDVRILARLTVLGIAAGIIPRNRIVSTRITVSRIAEATGLGSSRLRRNDELYNKINSIVPDISCVARREFGRRQLAYRASDDAYFILRDYWPGGWRPTFQLQGIEHIDAAIAAGHGAILWVGRFHASRLAWKKALHLNGIQVSHLSTPNHGFSPTQFGIKFLNPICTKIEDRYLHERVLLHVEKPVKALRRLREHLDANRVVSISDVARADKPIHVPFLGRSRTIAPGAPSLSVSSGAPILPLFPIRSSDDEFKIIIERPLEIPKEMKGQAARLALATEFTARLESHVRDCPESWEEWWCVT